MKSMSSVLNAIKPGWRSVLLPACVALLPFTPVSAAPPGEMPFGVYDPNGDFEADPEVAIEHLFLPWEDVFLPSLVDADLYAIERNRAVLATIEPWTWSRSERNSPDILRRNLLSGEYDQYMRGICAVLGTMDSAVTVRWAQEMDDYTSQFIWASWKPDDYITGYRRVVDICRAEAPNAKFMWSPLGYENLPEYYPGDDYVDLVGLSVFGLQAWEVQKFGKELSFVDILTPRYERAVQFGKPIVVAELGYVGNQAYVDKWENEVRQIYPQFPSLVGVVYFNQHEVYPWPDGFGLPDWRIGKRVTE
ncbi:MAG: beta-mannosidase [Roseovarius sp.]|nr:beta-mannosidase [Roseovarius sp.]